MFYRCMPLRRSTSPSKDEKFRTAHPSVPFPIKSIHKGYLSIGQVVDWSEWSSLYDQAIFLVEFLATGDLSKVTYQWMRSEHHDEPCCWIEHVHAEGSHSFLTDRKASTSLVHPPLHFGLTLPALLRSFDAVPIAHHPCEHSFSFCPTNSSSSSPSSEKMTG